MCLQEAQGTPLLDCARELRCTRWPGRSTSGLVSLRDQEKSAPGMVPCNLDLGRQVEIAAGGTQFSPSLSKGNTMPISEDEADRLISHIEMTVREVASDPRMQGVIGLIDQWKADVEAGRPIERKLSVRRSPGLDDLIEAPRSSSTTSGDFVGKVDYSKFEQLDLLVVALYLAFLAPSIMSERLLNTISKYSGEQNQHDQSDPVVDLLGVASPEASRTPSRISRETIAQSNRSTAKLATLLNEIIEEAELTPRRLMEGKDIA